MRTIVATQLRSIIIEKSWNWGDRIKMMQKIDGWILCRSEGGRPNRRLFCYVDKDSYKKPVTLVRNVVDHLKRLRSNGSIYRLTHPSLTQHMNHRLLHQKMPPCWERGTHPEPTSTYSDLGGVLLFFFNDRTLDSETLRNPVSETPSKDEKLAHRIITPPSQSMFLMADLRKLDGYVGWRVDEPHCMIDDWLCGSGWILQRNMCSVISR